MKKINILFVLCWLAFAMPSISLAQELTENRLMPHATYLFYPTTFDFDNDNDQDVVYEHLSYDNNYELNISENKGGMEFVPIKIHLNGFPQGSAFEGRTKFFDYDKDGKKDIMAVVRSKSGFSTWDQAVYFFKSIDSKHYEAAVFIAPLPYDANFICEYTDIDNDNDIDILFSATYYQYGSSGVYLLQNNNGSYSEITIRSGKPLDFYLQDMNNDGIKELVYTMGEVTQSYTFIANYIAGQFVEQKYINNGVHKAVKSILADINHDSLTDIIIMMDAGSYTYVVTRFNQGNFNFTNGSISIGSVTDIDAFDADGDNDIDLCAQYEGSNSNTVIMNYNLDGSFTSISKDTLYDSPSFSGNLGYLYHGDFNNDTYTDLVHRFHQTGIADGYQELVFTNSASGFSRDSLFNVLLEHDYNYSFFADLDGDSLSDIVTGIPTHHTDKNSLFWKRNTGGGVYTNPKTIHSCNWITKVADVDNDGDQDIMTNKWENGNSMNNDYFLYENDGAAHFTKREILSNFNAVDNIVPVLLDDFDNDGLKDVLLSKKDAGLIFAKNTGSGPFNYSSVINTNVIYTSNDYVTLYYAADMNKDGNLDLLVVQEISTIGISNLHLYLGNGNGTFQTGTLIYTTPIGDIWDVKTIDQDKDLDLDIFVTSLENFAANKPELVLLENNNMQFTKHVLGKISSTSMVPFDFDSDGDHDLVITKSANYNYYYDTLYLYENTGGLQFAKGKKINVNPNFYNINSYYYLRNIDVANVDGNSQLNIVSRSFNLSWFKNPLPSCTMVTSVCLDTVTTSTAEISWKNIGSGSQLELELTDSTGAQQLIPLSSGTKSTILTNLDACASYSFRIKTTCNGNTTGYSETIYFSTSCSITTGTAELDAFQPQIYPNPNTGSFSVLVASECTYVIYDVLGNAVASGRLTQHENKLNLDDMNSGVYFFECNSEEGSYTKKIIISK